MARTQQRGKSVFPSRSCQGRNGLTNVLYRRGFLSLALVLLSARTGCLPLRCGLDHVAELTDAPGGCEVRVPSCAGLRHGHHLRALPPPVCRLHVGQDHLGQGGLQSWPQVLRGSFDSLVQSQQS